MNELESSVRTGQFAVKPAVKTGDHTDSRLRTFGVIAGTERTIHAGDRRKLKPHIRSVLSRESFSKSTILNGRWLALHANLGKRQHRRTRRRPAHRQCRTEGGEDQQVLQLR
jgi:hypothetical protein